MIGSPKSALDRISNTPTELISSQVFWVATQCLVLPKNTRLNEQSVFEIIFVKLANFGANILEAKGDFLWAFVWSIGSVGKML